MLYYQVVILYSTNIDQVAMWTFRAQSGQTENGILASAFRDPHILVYFMNIYNVIESQVLMEYFGHDLMTAGNIYILKEMGILFCYGKDYYFEKIVGAGTFFNTDKQGNAWGTKD